MYANEKKRMMSFGKSKENKMILVLGHSPKEPTAMEIQVISSSVLSSCGGRCHSFNMEELPV